MAAILSNSVLISAASIAFNPLFWNLVARLEYNTSKLTKLFGGAKQGCYVLGATIILLGFLRDYLFKIAVAQHSSLPANASYFSLSSIIALLLLGVGNILVISSTYALGFTGTYLGDYFGILMSERVVSFPFNLVEHPMYLGSTLNFLGVAIYYRSPVGLLLTSWVAVCYMIASKYEFQFTNMIYSNATKKSPKKD
ncbi:Phosphatidyl-N-methylethanolamine N-methyltransferase [Smittium culicis]|uniref:Phosphatidyl-N-methylethanolamine N-methyltransferase n=1 Tax=Smittium culicis TaxID=133412 RepID=A0A1R1YCA4_9FUNG|nr:Phosphatidyl-N-methylethanolamine N-methyltransferase [Smittium culicis]